MRKLLKGSENLKPSIDARLPITKTILEKIIQSLGSCIHDVALQVLLKAVFLLAFHAFLRLGEILIRTPKDEHKVLQVHDLEFTLNSKTHPIGLTLVLRHFKNIKNAQPITISLERNTSNPLLCPIQALWDFRKIFIHKTGPLFQFQNESPVSYNFVSKKLAYILDFNGIDSKRVKGHSFRIGAATHAASLGYSEQYIRKLGRWHSNAVQNYIRISSFKF